MKNILLSCMFFQICWLSSIAGTNICPGTGNDLTIAATAFDAQVVVIENPDQVRCHADFRSDTLSEFTVKFEDRSWAGSHIIWREWSFGDALSGLKNKSHQKSPVHKFSGKGVFHVSLKIVSLTNCVDSVCKEITIGNTNSDVLLRGHVTNSVTGFPVAGQPVIINADIIHYSVIKMTDHNGFYQDTIPDAPSGMPIIVSVFDCNDSLHTQTVHSSSTPLEVNFSICALSPCKAVFTAKVDSNNLVQNTIIFTDSSEGHPDHWIWSFGDGTGSNDQNPVHSYQNSGRYTVCLTVLKKDLSGGIICSDSTCSVIETPSYYNLGGLAFAGLYPINNPTCTGDTGVSCIYKVQNNKIFPIDTVSFTYLGYYAFLHLLEGDYIVKTGLTKGSVHYGDFLPVYTGDQLKWQAASRVQLSGSNSYSNDVHLFQASPAPGVGSVGGYIVHREKGPLLGSAEVILYNANMEPISFTVSDGDGKFDFTSLGYGKYFLYPEITGKYARIKEVFIDEGSPAAEGIVLEVSDLDFTGIGDLNRDDGNSLIRVYPNPFSREINIQVSAEVTGKINLEIINLTGMIIWSSAFVKNNDDLILTLPLTDIPKGLYFLTVRSVDGAVITTRKIIKN